MPRHRAPGWGEAGDLPLVSGGGVQVDLHHGRLDDQLHALGDGVLRLVHAHDLEADQPLPDGGQHRCDAGLVGIGAEVRLVPPAIGKGVRVEQVGHALLGAVVEGRGQHLVGDLLGSERPVAHALQQSAPGLRPQRVGRHLDAAGLALHLGQFRLDPVGHPAGVERKRDHRRIADGRPHQPRRGVGEAADRVPGRVARRGGRRGAACRSRGTP